MDRPDVVVTWLQNDYGQLGRAAESVAHALVDEGLAGTVAYVEPPLPGTDATLTAANDRGLHVYTATGAHIPGPAVASTVVANSGLTDPVLLNFGVGEANWWFQHAFGPLVSRSVVVSHDLLHTWPGMDADLSRRLRRIRSLLFGSADAVAGLSEGAVADRHGAHYVGHGCDAVWTRPGVDACGEPADLAAVPHPRALYYGALSVRIDTDAVRALADSGVHVVLVGFAPAPPVAQLIAEHPRVHFLGAKNPDESAAYLLHCDVGIVPHTDEPFTASMEPHKIYNYACAGLPVVALHCVCPPALRPLVMEVGDAAAFTEAVGGAATVGRLDADAVAHARSITWGSVARRLLEVAVGGAPKATDEQRVPALA